MNPLLCPNRNDEEWKTLLKREGNNFSKAFAIYMQHGYNYPEDIIEAVKNSKTLNTEEFTTALREEREGTDSGGVVPGATVHKVLTDKERILEKSEIILKKKIKALTYAVKKNPHLEEGKAQLEKLLNQMTRLEADAALNNFIITADKMTQRAEGWMKKALSSNEPVSLESIRGMYDYVASFSILDDLAEDMFEDPEHVKDLEIVKHLSGRREAIKKSYLKLSRKALAISLAKDFDKVVAEYRRLAEVDFNKNHRDTFIRKGLSKSQIADAKADYIQGYMETYAEEIEQKTIEYVEGMLVQSVDISTASHWFVNPRDLGHDITGKLVQQLDHDDFMVTQKTIRATDEADELYQKFIAHVGKKGNPKDQYEVLLDRDPEGNIMTVIINENSPNWEGFKTKYQGTPVMEMHAFLEKLIKEKDAAAGNLKLGYSLPHINKNSMERIYANGVLHTLKAGTIDHFKLRAEDTEFGDIESRLNQGKSNGFISVITNEAGREREQVPLHYRAKVDEKDMSFDVLSSILLDYNNSLVFETRVKNAITFEVMKDVVGDMDLVQRSAFKKLNKVDQLGKVVTVKGEGSNLQKSIDNILRQRIYGITIEGDPELAKLAKTIQSYTSVVGMAANWVSGTANLLQGQTMSWIESAGKNTGLYNTKDRLKAVMYYDKDLAGILADAGQRVPKSKTNLLARKLDAFSDYNPVEKRFVENNRLKRMANTNSLMVFNNAGEHMAQSVVMYSILENIKVLTVDGSYLDKDGNPTTNKAEAMSLAQAFYVNEKGELALPENVAKTTKTSGVTDEDMYKIHQLISRTNRDLYGNYDGKNKSVAQRHILGAMAFQMRGWLIPGFQKRWKGIGNMKTSSEDLTLDQRIYNQETGQFEEGTYTTTLRLLYSIGKDVKGMKLQAVPFNWAKLSDMEKANFKKATLELGIAVAMLVVASSFRDGDEPEDVYIAFFARRMYSELTTFVNPQESVRTFRNPLMILNTIDDGLKLVSQTFDPYETYTSGKHSGEYKIKRRLMKLIPIWKQLDRDIQESLLFLEK